MTYKATIVAAVLAAAAASFAPAANAGPLGAFQKNSNVERSDLQQVHWRGYRHCHRRYGRRYCHGGYRGYRHYGYGPGITLRFGFGPRWHRHRHHHHRRHWR